MWWKDNKGKVKYFLPVATFFCLALLGSFSILVTRLHNKKYDLRRQYEQETRSLCQEVMGSFDRNNNGGLDFDEGVEMTRTFGIRTTFPGNQIIFELRPGDYKRQNVMLKTYSHGLDSRRGRDPAWSYDWSLPLSKLKEVAESRCD